MNSVLIYVCSKMYGMLSNPNVSYNGIIVFPYSVLAMSSNNHSSLFLENMPIIRNS